MNKCKYYDDCDNKYDFIGERCPDKLEECPFYRSRITKEMGYK